ncbi:hypothetical protein AAU61_06500 [Desulfocarbo indianensis]|nr:hypothetical protein AAU61_06500 [Desulfocarbo indianensis]
MGADRVNWPARLKALRKTLGLTQVGLGAKWEINPNTIYRLERGVYPVSGAIRALIRAEERLAELEGSEN